MFLRPTTDGEGFNASALSIPCDAHFVPLLGIDKQMDNQQRLNLLSNFIMIDYLQIAKNESYKRSFDYSIFYAPSAPWLSGINRYQINIIKLLMVDTPARLSHLLEKHIFDLQLLINEPKYISFKILKSKGGYRTIFAPNGQLKHVQKILNYYLQAYYLYIKPKEIHGFVIHPKSMHLNSNIVENAKMHTHKKYVLNIDLKDFFPSISSFLVKEMFMSFPFEYTEQIATALALLTTYEGKLPIGAPTSPVISNFICKQLDADLIDFAAKNQLTYSRYADDLTFSSNLQIESESIVGIRELIEKNRFMINEKKFRLQSSNRRQTVTGITVNEKVNVNRKLLKKIRAMLHDWSTRGLLLATYSHFCYSNYGKDIDKLQQQFVNRLSGYINFVGQVRGKNDLIYLRFKAQYKEITKGAISGNPNDPFNPVWH